MTSNFFFICSLLKKNFFQFSLSFRVLCFFESACDFFESGFSKSIFVKSSFLLFKVVFVLSWYCGAVFNFKFVYGA